jgi:hypothetical protein
MTKMPFKLLWNPQKMPWIEAGHSFAKSRKARDHQPQGKGQSW